MKKAIIILFVLISSIQTGNAQSDNIAIKTEGLQEANYLKMNDFYLTHYLYLDLFIRENLYLEATVEDVSAVIKAIKTYVSPDNKLDIEIKKPGKQKYIIRFVLLQKDGKELLIAFTNWTTEKKKFEKEIKFENNSYTRWYFLNGSKMTYRKDMSTENDYTSMTPLDLANAYLFDELADNDAQIEPQITNVLEEEGVSVADEIYARLLLLKYEIFRDDSEGIEMQVKHLDKLFESNETSMDLRGWKSAYDMTKFQIALTKELE
ncbi:hypothetical protein SAMN05216480_12111 [Pustulibacterium marinum]|uniref:DUF4476 domain-containing protein n=1 Tax=Pustulibacterium marinum TaxID=1224947 RepID=A0A1I7ISN2_9FLAO|nr:hypothetical protein [Pustulibacterium marinum]SFU75902.1 hypothetical protein SAMN05216480_12111 [Pustulibacterium marinum]